MTTILIESVNCRGLRNFRKRSDIFLKAQENRVNILCLQETHLVDADKAKLRDEWNINFFLSGKDSKSGGVLIACDNNFEFKVHKTTIDHQGRFIIMDLELIDVARVLLCNLYAPNEDNPNFFIDLFSKIEDYNTKNLILTGDWNFVMDFNTDTYNYKKLNNPKAHKTVKQFMEKLYLIDIWRETHLDSREYTWRQNFYKKWHDLIFSLYLRQY